MNSVLVLCSAEHDTVYCESMIQICKIKLIATELPHSCGAILMSNPSNAGMNLLQSVSSVSHSSPGIYLAYFTSYIESFSLIGAFVLCHLCNILYQVCLFRKDSCALTHGIIVDCRAPLVAFIVCPDWLHWECLILQIPLIFCNFSQKWWSILYIVVTWREPTAHMEIISCLLVC